MSASSFVNFSSSSNSLGLSPSKSSLELSTSDVFDKIRPLVCSIISTIGESSGFFIKPKTVLTVAHNISSETNFVQINYKGKPSFPTPSPNLVQEHAKVLDLYSMASEMQLEESAMIPILPEKISLKEGMKVYFAGYPLGQDCVTFHKGTISSIIEDQGIKWFTIDGTVVPGNSGGPVVIQQEGKLYLAGIITSEVADFSPEDLKIIAIMKALKEFHQANSNSGVFMQVGGTTLGESSGLTTSITINTPQGPEQIKVSDRETISLALDLIQRNLSTGIGKAIDVRHYKLLFLDAPKVNITSNFSFPVGKGKKLITGSLINQTNKQTIAKYMEVRYGSTGAGNRGVRITLQSPGIGFRVYKFSPNPHTAQGNYNKNQEELYSNAVKGIMSHYIQNGEWLGSLIFDACKATYTAKVDY